MNLIQYLVVLASYVQISSGACYEVTSNFSIWSVILVSWSVGISQRPFPSHGVSIVVVLRLSYLYLTQLRRTWLDCHVQIFLLTFPFLSSRVQGVWFYCCVSDFFLFCHNFLTFLSQASSDNTLVAIGYLFVSIPKASSALSLGLQWSLWWPAAI